jgi:hypothetical protein
MLLAPARKWLSLPAQAAMMVMSLVMARCTVRFQKLN